MTIASNNDDFAEALARAISDDKFRAYTSDDMIGVEVGGAVKNVLAIGAGMSDGLGFGANTRIALINRGLVELMRLGVALGAKRETFIGLAGMGDLVLTCTDNLSKRRKKSSRSSRACWLPRQSRKSPTRWASRCRSVTRFTASFTRAPRRAKRSAHSCGEL